ncbi:MAG: aldo/keto reductase [bacterium]|nr:aldo/keto reductase [bacterium]
MKTRILGRTGLHCSEVALGTWAFNSVVYGPVADGAAQETVRCALDQGITLFDTAPLYGTRERDGIAEEVLGRALGADRENVLISTKFGRRATRGNVADFNAANVRSSVDESLARLGTDHIDVLFFHSPFGPDDIDDDVWQALDDVREQGKVRAIGHSISKFAETQDMAREWVLAGRVDVIQVVYSLLNREATALIRDLAAAGAGIVAREALANGFLSGAVTRDTVFPAGSLNARYSREDVAARVAQVERLEFLVRDPVAALPQAALRWVLDNPAVSSVLTGARNAAEVVDCGCAAGLPGYHPAELAQAWAVHERDFPAA